MRLSLLRGNLGNDGYMYLRPERRGIGPLYRVTADGQWEASDGWRYYDDVGWPHMTTMTTTWYRLPHSPFPLDSR